MALRLYNGSGHDSFAGTPSLNTTNEALTTTFKTGIAAPSMTIGTPLTGVMFFVSTVFTAGSVEVEIRESGVSKVSAIANLADLTLGPNWIKFPTPYLTTTAAAGAYVPWIRNPTNTNGNVARDTASAVAMLGITKTDASALGSTDDVLVLGGHNSGLTPVNRPITGTTLSWGSGQNKNISSTANRLINNALTIGNGGSVTYDNTADSKLNVYGNVMVYVGGVYDQRAGAYNSELTFTMDTDGDHALITANSTFGGVVLMNDNPLAVAATYTGGLGTAANPVTTAQPHGMAVNQQVVIGFSDTYQKNEVRLIKSIPSSTSMVLSTTAGGAEAALIHTHATGTPLCNMTRSSVIRSADSTKGFSIYHSSTHPTPSDFGNTRYEYPNCLSGRGLNLSSTGHAANIDGMVLYNNSANGRTSISWNGSVVQTSRDIILFNTRGSNFSAQSGLAVINNNKTIENLYHFAEPNSTTCCAGLSISATATSAVIKNYWSSGGNAANAGAGYSLGVYGNGNTFEGIHIDNSRQRGLLMSASLQNTFVNSDFGTRGSNVIDVDLTAATLNQALFTNCSFGSPLIIDKYKDGLPGTDIAFHKFNKTDNRHRWYTINGSGSSSGAGLDETTVATAGSLALALRPETTTGIRFTQPIPVRVGEVISKFGKFWCNATFLADPLSSLTAELYLPGSLTPDQTVTLTKTTDPTSDNAVYQLTKQNTATVGDVAQIILIAKSAVAGAKAFVDDLDGGTNPISALDIWYQGKPLASQLLPATLGDPAAAAAATWNYPDTTTNANTMGRRQVETAKNTKLLKNVTL